MKNIRNILVISPDCRESVIPLESPLAKSLYEYGLRRFNLSEINTRFEMGKPNPRHHFILISIKGNAWLCTNEKDYSIKPNHIVIVPAGTAHAYGLKGREWQCIRIALENNKKWLFLSKTGVQIHETDHTDSQKLRDVGFGFIREAGFQRPFSEQAAKQYAGLIITYLDRKLVTSLDPKTREIRNNLFALWNCINADLRRNWTTEKLSKEMNVSSSYLFEIVKKYGESSLTPMQMVIRLRMQRAGEFLLNTDYPLKQIAPLVGYEDPFAFSSAFKKYVGCSPKFYREKNTKANYKSIILRQTFDLSPGRGRPRGIAS